MSNGSEVPIETETETEKRERPTFEDWCDKTIRGREDYVVLRTNVIFYGVMSNLSFCRAVLIQLGKENNGMQKEDSPEFRKIQTEWWYYYRKIMTLRSFLVRYFDIPSPNWMKDLLPDRLYCGVLLSEEDFLKFVTTEGSGIVKERINDVSQYEDELKQNKLAAREVKKQVINAIMKDSNENDAESEEESEVTDKD